MDLSVLDEDGAFALLDSLQFSNIQTVSPSLEISYHHLIPMRILPVTFFTVQKSRESRMDVRKKVIMKLFFEKKRKKKGPKVKDANASSLNKIWKRQIVGWLAEFKMLVRIGTPGASSLIMAFLLLPFFSWFVPIESDTLLCPTNSSSIITTLSGCKHIRTLYYLSEATL